MFAMGQHGIGTVGRLVRDIALALVAVGCIAGWYTVSTVYGATLGGSEIVDRGVAVARGCEFSGPVGSRSLGWWWTCQADVRWDGRGHAKVEFIQSQLTNSHVGQEVPVVLRKINKGRGKGSYLMPYRADFEPRPVLGNALSIPLLMVSSLISLFIVIRIWRAIKARM